MTRDWPDLAQAALRHWGGAAVPPRLINHRENAVFEVRLRDGRRAALRLHRSLYRTAAEILAELQWTEALCAAGFAAPRPIPTLGGDRIAAAEAGRDGEQILATLIAWVDGRPIGAGDQPLSGRPEEQCTLFRELGETLARLHNATDTLGMPNSLARPRWDREALTGEEPLWGRYWEHPRLGTRDRATILAARKQARQELEGWADADFGLIHADALRENVFRTAEGLVLIDYDDCGFGYRLYDLAVALSQGFDRPELPLWRQALAQGYGTLRPLSPRALTLLPMFEMLRAFASLGWTQPRLSAGDPKTAAYMNRAVQLAERYLAGSQGPLRLQP